jgi:hypothetical protein
MIDSHVHLVDFRQRRPSRADVIAAVDGAGVDGAVVFGMSVKKTWPAFEPKKPGYYLDDNAPCIHFSLTDQLVADLVVDLPPEDQRRLAPLICGIDPADRLAVDDIERMWKKYPFWRGSENSCFATMTSPTSRTASPHGSTIRRSRTCSSSVASTTGRCRCIRT